MLGCNDFSGVPGVPGCCGSCHEDAIDLGYDIQILSMNFVVMLEFGFRKRSLIRLLQLLGNLAEYVLNSGLGKYYK